MGADEVKSGVVKMSKLGVNCWMPARVLGLCHERCKLVRTCDEPEAVRSRLIVAKQALVLAQGEVEFAQTRVKEAQEECDKLPKEEGEQGA